MMRQWSISLAGLILGLAVAPCRGDSPETTFQKLDINEDGRLSGKEIDDESRDYDTNGDGRITRDEYLAGARTRAAGADAEQAFAQRDVNEDGWLSGKETKGIEGYDKDGDGEISKEEFAAGLARKKPEPDAGRMSREEAERAFNELDVTEDGVLSGTEKASVAAYDANQDGRVTLEEFLAGSAPPKRPGLFDRLLSPFTNRKPGAEQRKPPASVEESLAAAVTANDARALLQMAHPELAKQVDEPILRFMLQLMPAKLGERQEAEVKFTTTPEERGDQTYLVHEATVLYESGTATYSFRSLDGKLVSLSVGSDDVPNSALALLERLLQDDPFSNDLRDALAPRGEKMIRSIFAGEDQAAFGMLHPQVQKQLPLEDTLAGFAKVRELFGELQELELLTMRFETGEQGQLQNLQFEFEAKCEKAPAVATAILEIAGYQGALVGYNVRPAESAPPGKPKPRPELTLDWRSSEFPEEGWKFQLPGEPQTATDDKGGIKHTVSLPEHQMTFVARMLPDNNAGREREFLQAYEAGLKSSAGKGLLEYREMPLGEHPSAAFVLVLKSGGLLSSRRIVLSDRKYDLDVFHAKDLSEAQKGSIQRFFESVELLEESPPAPPAPAPPVPAPPMPPETSELTLKWQSLTYPKEGWKFQIPGNPATATKLGNITEHTVSLPEAGLTFTARVTRVSNAGKESQTLDAHEASLKQSRDAKVLDVDPAPCGEHPGKVFFVQAKEGSFLVQRKVVTPSRIYDLELVLTAEPTDAHKSAGRRYLESLELIELR